MLATVASNNEGVEALADTFEKHYAASEASGALAARRTRRLEVRTREVVDRAVRRWLWNGGAAGGGSQEAVEALEDVRAGAKTPYEAAAAVVARLTGAGGRVI